MAGRRPHSRSAGGQLTRRGLLSAGGALAIGALTAGCGDSGNDEPAGGGDPDGWSFTDDRGETATAAETPQRVVAYVGSAAALHDFGVTDQVVGVFGPTGDDQNGRDPLAGELELDRLTVLGQNWGEFNLEAYLALDPQLLVTDVWQGDDLWYVPDESADEILSQAPSAGIRVAHVSLLDPITRYAQLAESLGADLSDPLVTDAQARFDEAAEAVREAAADNPGLRVLAASASPDLFYVSDPSVYPDLSFFAELGVELVVPDQVDAGGFFEPLSWENSDKYPADLVLLDSRTVALQPEQLTDLPGWGDLPAVTAAQVTPWLSEPRFSYAGCAPLLTALADAIRTARPVA
ncbi:ABC transporter substrate-binding protein [Natronosporangium hydrolyticum]|uniref:ABC transporter substrate-binding protein n=1 Tax=Natronosporangium hydrolyticum TaxID=2811111 RepID=A0A895Y915_9ACTN|nr:ABC transporter substrate-binding protein [Natronosporangium hydrolyticum]QSB13821.1 ABC transporter substrate-binding protein [Natronosporangium hydrolyticum]